MEMGVLKETAPSRPARWLSPCRISIWVVPMQQIKWIASPMRLRRWFDESTIIMRFFFRIDFPNVAFLRQTGLYVFNG
jgi:hypothetical protein